MEKRKANSAWSKHTERKEEKVLRKEKRIRKRKWLKSTGENVPGTSNHEEDQDDWQELAREERMAKKVKKGEIDQHAFDAEFGADF
jgi:ATP-dependent RNA helicase DDX55/SPB4